MNYLYETVLDPQQFSVIQTIHCNVSLKCFFSILPKCFCVINVIYAHFIDISQGSVETHLRCGGMCNNRVITNCSQSASERILKIGQWLAKI